MRPQIEWLNRKMGPTNRKTTVEGRPAIVVVYMEDTNLSYLIRTSILD